jgi:hypothetical protein
MTEPPKDLVLEQLRLLRGDFERMETKFDTQLDELSHKVGSIAQTLIVMQRDIRRLTDTVEIHGAAIAEHTARFDRLENRQPPA